MSGRPSLSRKQIADPIGTLAVAYGVERSFKKVCEVVTDRVAGRDGSQLSGPNLALGPVIQILAAVAQDGRNLGRIYRGSPLAAPYRKTVATMVRGYDIPGGPDQFISAVFAEVRSALHASYS